MEDSLSLYEKHIKEKIINGDIDIDKLKGKTIGCFCEMSNNLNEEDCHTKFLYKFIQ